MKIKVALPWLLAVAALVGTYAFDTSGKTKETELAALRLEVQELQRLKAEYSGLKNVQVSSDEVERLRKDNADLPRLRNEVRQLRDEKQQLTKQAQTAQAQFQTAQAQAQALRTNAPPTLTPDQRKAFEQRYGLQPQAGQDPAQALVNACINNLRQIDGAKQQWALENRKPATALVNQTELLRYFKDNTMPVCPAGGSYSLTTVGLAPICNIPGHALPK